MANVFNWMESPTARAVKRPLDVQSRGRNLSDLENEFADALEKIFTTGISNIADVSKELTVAKVVAPGGGGRIWTVSTLKVELEAINASLDAAHDEDGYGA